MKSDQELARLPNPFAASQPDAGALPNPFDPAYKRPSRSVGQRLTDTGIGIAQGAANLAGGLAELPNLATGGFVDRAIVRPAQRGLDRALGGPGEDNGGIAGGISRINDGLDAAKSPVLQQRQQNLSAAMQGDGNWMQRAGRAAKEVATDPVLIGQFLAEQVPILGTLGAGAAGTAGRAAGKAQAAGLTGQAARDRVQSAVQGQLVGANVAMGAGFSGQEAVQRANDMTDADWARNPEYVALAAEIGPEAAKQKLAIQAGQVAAPVGGAISGLASRLTAPFEAGVFTRQGSNLGLPAAVGKEFAEEAIQEGGETFAANLGINLRADPEQALFEGVPEAAAVGGTIGGIIGGGLYAGGRLTQRSDQNGPPGTNEPAGALPPPTYTDSPRDPAREFEEQRAAMENRERVDGLYAERTTEEARRQAAIDALAPQPEPGPQQTPALPAPELADNGVMAVTPDGQARPQFRNEAEAAEAARQQRSIDMGLTPDVVAAQQRRQSQAQQLAEMAQQPDAGPLTKAVGNNIEKTSLGQQAPALTGPGALEGELLPPERREAPKKEALRDQGVIDPENYQKAMGFPLKPEAAQRVAQGLAARGIESEILPHPNKPGLLMVVPAQRREPSAPERDITPEASRVEVDPAQETQASDGGRGNQALGGARALQADAGRAEGRGSADAGEPAPGLRAPVSVGDAEPQPAPSLKDYQRANQRERQAATAAPDRRQSKKPRYEVAESPTNQRARKDAGYTEIVEVDARALRDAYEKDNGERLAWDQRRTENLESVKGPVDDYPRAGIMDGRINVGDGRHRIDLAAKRGQTIPIAALPEQAAELRQRLGITNTAESPAVPEEGAATTPAGQASTTPAVDAAPTLATTEDSSAVQPASVTDNPASVTANEGSSTTPDPAADEIIVSVRTVYGDTVRVRKADLDSGRDRLPMYQKDGARKKGPSSILVRGNIAKDDAQIAEVNKDMPLINAADGKTFKTPMAVKQRIRQMQLDPEDYEVQGDKERGFVGVRKKAASPEPAPATARSDKEIGTNSRGERIFEDANGVRYVMDGNVRIMAAVEMVPTRAPNGGIRYETRPRNDDERMQPVADATTSATVPDTAIERAREVFRRIKADKSLPSNSGIDTKLFDEQIEEQIANPARYHKIQEIDNDKGLKIGDPVTVGGTDGYVVTMERVNGKVRIKVAKPSSYGGFYDIDSVLRRDPNGKKPQATEDPAAESPADPRTDAASNAQPVEKTAPKVSENAIFTEDAAAKARELLRKKLGQLNTGIDPEIMQAGITLAGYHIEKGARTFTAYAQAMVADLGESVKPYLKSWYMGVKYDPRASGFDGMTDAAGVESADVDALTRESSNATRELDSPGTGTLEGAPAAGVQADDGGRDTAEGADRGGRADGAGDRADGGRGVQPQRGVGSDAGEVPVRAGRARREPRAAKEQGLQGDGRVQPGDRSGDDAGRAQQLERPRSEPAFTPADFIIGDDLELGAGGQKTKFKNNVAAIRILKELDAQGRTATPAEQQALALYVGWGGIPQAFDSANTDWSKEHAELKGLLTPEEYATAERSTRYAHYTSREIIGGIYDAVRAMGFSGGKVLEPGAGVGNFIGLMPSGLKSGTRVTAVEREALASGIARHLYPQQNIQRADFAQFQALDGYFDAVIGNPPFASDALTDQSGRKHLSGLSVHNYFFAKSVDLLREGGVLAMVVSNSFMDAKRDNARNYIADRTRLLGAIRLPNNAFSKNANTEVTTDIIFLQKRPESEWGSKAAKAEAKAWLEPVRVPDPRGGDALLLNPYFRDNPEMMLGEWGRFGTMYGPDQPALVARPNQDTGAMLREAVQRLPKNVYVSAAVTGTEALVDQTVEALNNPEVQEGGFFERDGKLYQRLPDVAGEARGRVLTPETYWTPKTKLGENGFVRIKALTGIRNTLRSLLAAEMDDASNTEKLRADLNRQYDAYVKENGLINGAGTSRVFDDDPDYPLLAALEFDYTPAVREGEGKARKVIQKESAKKAPIFSKRVVEARQPITRAESPADALQISIAERGAIDERYIGQLLGMDPESVLQELSEGSDPLLFKDPGTDSYVLRDEYLSGNVREKLKQAREAGMVKNARALEKVIPEDVPSHEISVRLGAPWVPEKVYQDFAVELFGEGTRASIKHVSMTNGFSVDIRPGSQVNNRNRWGTEEYPGDELLAAILNFREIKVTYRDHEGKAHTNVDATERAKVKASEIRERFSDWAFSDPDRAEVMTRRYNDANNNYVTRTYDGSWLRFPGKVPDSLIKFRRHQRNAIARIVQARTVLLDHVVGAGKTYTVIAGAMELRRTGLAKKPLIVVPNHLVKQWAADFYRLYPGAKVLTATKKDFERSNRRRFLAKIATGDWDAVVMAHSSYGFIKPSPDFEADFNQKQIDLVMDTIKQVEEDKSGEDRAKKKTVKQLQAVQERLENRIKSLRERPIDGLLDFSQLGVDQLFVDEAHLFKNLMFTTKMQNVRGLGDSKGAQRAYDMFIKVNELYGKNGRGQGVVFATGTPVSNSLAEMYHMMRYLMPNQMESLGFQSFDAWAATYAQIEETLKPTTSGSYKTVTSFENFHNAHELLKTFDQVSDTVTQDDIKAAFREENAGKEFPLPRIKTGRRQPVALQRSAEQDAYMDEISKRAEALESRRGPPQKGEDNHLSLMSDARKAAMDIRLVKTNIIEREKGGRIDRAADEVLGRYRTFDSVKGTQLVFSDLGTPLKHAKGELKEYQELQATIERAADEDVISSANLGNEDALEIIEKAEEAQAELDAKGPDWLDAVQAALRGFSVYDDLKAALVERGIPADEIAFIHDYNTDDRKASLYRAVNEGRIRVVVGSTPKMGAGTNVQQRLVALHHLDIPWKPSDVEQREGRIVRQGNLFSTPPTENVQNPLYDPDFEVEILAYVTKDTLDKNMWDIQERKIKGINQLKTRQVGRVIENSFDDMEMSASEMQAAATGNMDLLTEIRLKNDIKKLEQKKRSYEAQANDAISRRRRAERDIEALPSRIEEAERVSEASADYNKRMKAAQPAFKATIDGKEFTDEAAAKARLEEIIEATTKGEDGKERKAAIRTDFNGEVYTSRATLTEAFAEARGDATPILFERGGQKLFTRRSIGRAIQQDVVDAIADERPIEIGAMGDFKITVEGGTAGTSGDAYLDVAVSLGDFAKDVQLPVPLSGEPIDKARILSGKVIKFAESVIQEMRGEAAYLKSQLGNAQKTLADLNQNGAMGPWPDAPKLEALRSQHRELLAKINREAAAKKEAAQAKEEAPDLRAADTAAGRGFTPTQAREIIARRFGKGAENLEKAGILKVIAGPQDYPQKYAAYLRKMEGSANIKGFYDPEQGAAYVIPGNIKSEDDLVKTVLHEIGEHYGLKTMLGEEAYGRLLNQLEMLKSTNPRVRQAFENVGRLYKHLEPGSERFLREVLASASEDPSILTLPWYKQLIQAIRRFLFKTGIVPIRFTDAELAGMVAASLRQSMRLPTDGPRGGRREPVMASMADAEVVDVGFELPNGKRFARVSRDETGERYDYFFTRAEAERAAGGQALDRANEALGQDRGAQQDGAARYARDDEGRARFLTRYQSAAFRSVLAVRQAAAQGRIKPDPQRVHNCYLHAAQAATAGDFDMLIGRATMSGGGRGWHAVVRLPDGGIFDAVEKQFYAPGVYERVGGFAPVRALNANAVRAFLTANDGLTPDPRSLGIENDPAIDFRLDDPAGTINRISAAARKLPSASDFNADQRSTWLRALTRQQIVDVGKDQFNTASGNLAQQFERIARQIEADSNNELNKPIGEGRRTFGEIAEAWAKMTSPNPLGGNRAGAAQLARVMHDATLAGLDPDRKMPDGADPAEYARLRKAFVALPADVQALYRDVRDAYAKRRVDFEKALEQRIEESKASGSQKRAMLNSLRQQFEAGRVKGPYFPLARFGDYYVVAEKDGEREFVMAESQAEQRRELERLKAEGFTVRAGKSIKGLASEMGKGNSTFIADMVNMIDAEVSGPEADALKDGLWQMYLQSLPELSVRKKFIHRKGTPGFSQDALRAFASQIGHGSKQIARLRHAHKLSDALRAMKEHAPEAPDPNKAADILKALDSSYQWMMNPNNASWANNLTNLGFAWYLGVSPAAAAVNMTQLPIVTLPVLAAKSGWAAASSAMGTALKDYTGSRFNKAARARLEAERGGGMGRMLKELEDSGAISRTMSMSLMGLSDANTAAAIGSQRMMKFIGGLFHGAEVMNREITAIAAYRLGRDAGKSHEAATQDAYDAIFESHFDYSSENRAEFMRGNVARVILLFKQYSQNMSYFLARNFHQSFKGASKEERREAATKLLGTVGMTAAFSGTMGLPLVGMMMTLTSLLEGLLGDDDEPWDAEAAYRKWLTDNLGDAGNVVAKGFANLSGADIASRTSLNELWFRRPDRELEGQALAQHYIGEILGPVVGIGVDMTAAAQLFAEGNLQRGFEKAVPKFVRDWSKAVRFEQEGALNMRGDPVVEQFKAGEVAMQAVGLTPATLSEQYDRSNAMKRVEQRIIKRRQSLVNLYVEAANAGDEDMMREAIASIARYNKAQPTWPITGDSLRRSIRSRAQYGERMIGGVGINPRLRDLVIEQTQWQ